MLDFLLFRRMLTPLLVQLFFWLGLVLCVVGGIFNLLHHAIAHGLQILFIGPLLLRIFCEFLMIFFQINERLTGLKNTVQHTP
jgi:Domain of unknown function (DUF4282)